MRNTEVVINEDYGGFGLSPVAMVELVEMTSPLIKKMTMDEYTGGRPLLREPSRMGDSKYCSFSYDSVICDDGYVYTLSTERYDETFRSHPDLVGVVKKLKKSANGRCASLKVVSIPSDIEWGIEEYDGKEWIAEKHRVWS